MLPKVTCLSGVSDLPPYAAWQAGRLALEYPGACERACLLHVCDSSEVQPNQSFFHHSLSGPAPDLEVFTGPAAFGVATLRFKCTVMEKCLARNMQVVTLNVPCDLWRLPGVLAVITRGVKAITCTVHHLCAACFIAFAATLHLYASYYSYSLILWAWLCSHGVTTGQAWHCTCQFVCRLVRRLCGCEAHHPFKSTPSTHTKSIRHILHSAAVRVDVRSEARLRLG